MIDTFYVYVHLQADTLVPFYVGKGTSRVRGEYQRASDFCRRKRIWKGVAGRHGVIVTLHAEFWNEDDALNHEASLITALGRRENGTGPLVNHTDGGKGCSGYKMSPDFVAQLIARNTGRVVSAETRAKQSAAMKGERHWKYGSTESSETRAKKAASMRGKNLEGRAVVDRSSGRVFPSVSEAARVMQMPQRTLNSYLNGDRRNRTTMEFA